MAKETDGPNKPSLRQLRRPPFETGSLREELKKFYESPYEHDPSGEPRKIGEYKWGVYIFYDYDNEPIYVGQTNERVSARIGRHLTNQRTDAVAMNVLDPFEVYSIEVYPLPEFQHVVNNRHPDYGEAKRHLDSLEFLVHEQAIKTSRYGEILNEKDPKQGIKRDIPKPHRRDIVAKEVQELRAHPDVRIARRAATISKLAQVISEREIKGTGLRRVLLVQSQRLETLAKARFHALGGKSKVLTGAEGDASEDEEAPDIGSSEE